MTTGSDAVIDVLVMAGAEVPEDDGVDVPEVGVLGPFGLPLPCADAAPGTRRPKATMRPIAGGKTRRVTKVSYCAVPVPVPVEPVPVVPVPVLPVPVLPVSVVPVPPVPVPAVLASPSGVSAGGGVFATFFAA